MVDFAGWEMPVYYQGILEEHRAVRERAGLFDVSHMGEVEVRGAGALAACQRLVTNDVSKLVDGGAQYAVMCLPSGGIVDDVIYYRLAADRVLFCVNASNAEKDFRWMHQETRGAEVADRSADYAQLALQGPKAEEILQPLVGIPLRGLRGFHAVEIEVGDVSALVSRTGYTGEDGFEIYVAPEHAERLWDRLLEQGERFGLVPVGLGARDTLRLEKGLMLYGNDIDETTTPLEAGLGWVVKLEKGDFIGRDALVRQRADGVPRRMVGLMMPEGAPPPRHGYRVVAAGRPVGSVTSGSKSPTLGRGIALALVERQASHNTSGLEVEIRSRQHPAEIVPLPFVRGPKH
jgi:aminomethyltransferase